MTTFALTGNYLPEEVDGKPYVAVYCLVKGDVRFSRMGFSAKLDKSPRDDESGKQLLQQIGHLNEHYGLLHQESINADIVMDNVIVVRFQVNEAYNRDIVTHLYDIIHGYCLVEEALGTTRSLEGFDDLFKQIRSLLLELRVLKKSEESPTHLKYLVTSIRYGARDVFGGIIPPVPHDYKRTTLVTWLKPIRKRITEQRKLKQ